MTNGKSHKKNNERKVQTAEKLLQELLLYINLFLEDLESAGPGLHPVPARDRSGQQTESEPAGDCESVKQDQRKPDKVLHLLESPPLRWYDPEFMITTPAEKTDQTADLVQTLS